MSANDAATPCNLNSRDEKGNYTGPRGSQYVKVFICHGCQSCYRMNEDGSVTDTGPHYMSVELVSDHTVKYIPAESLVHHLRQYRAKNDVSPNAELVFAYDRDGIEKMLYNYMASAGDPTPVLAAPLSDTQRDEINKVLASNVPKHRPIMLVTREPDMYLIRPVGEAAWHSVSKEEYERRRYSADWDTRAAIIEEETKGGNHG